MAQKDSIAVETLRFVRITALLGLTAGMFVSYKLWFSPRLFPTVPVFEILPQIHYPLDYFLCSIFGLLIGLVLIGVFERTSITLLIIMAILFVIWDQNRLQPWFYIYVVILLGYVQGARAENLKAFQLMLASVYVWSGVQKLNLSFAAEIFPKMFPFLGTDSEVLWIGLAAAASELMLGCALLFKKFQTISAYLLITMHVLLLIILGPYGHGRNSVIWPWNVCMSALLYKLFISKSFNQNTKRNSYYYLTLVLVGLMPLLNFWNLWDSYPSFSLYSGNVYEANILISDQGTSKLNYKLQPLLKKNNEAPKFQHRISLAEWSVFELGVPVYPEPRIFRGVFRKLCETMPELRDEIALLIYSRPTTLRRSRKTELMRCD